MSSSAAATLDKSARAKPPFRAEHVGSLLRPPELKAARDRLEGNHHKRVSGTRRFPELNFAFLEGGVGWAASLFADLIGHWEKRNRDALENTNPANLDHAELLALHGLDVAAE